MIVDFLVGSARPVIVLRGSKMLANSDWMGGSYRLLPATAVEVRDLLDTIPVHFIVLDSHGFFDEGSRPNHRLLVQTLSDEPNQFRLIADIPLVVDRRQSQHMIQVYENLHAQGRKPEVIRIPMQTSLRRTIEVNVRDWNTAGARSVPTSKLGVAIASAFQPIAANLRLVHQSQDHPASGLRIRPTGETIGAEGGPGEFSVQADSREWDVLSTAPWIAITPKRHGAGDRVLRYAVARNDSNQIRSGSIEVGDTRYTVVQRARP